MSETSRTLFAYNTHNSAEPTPAVDQSNSMVERSTAKVLTQQFRRAPAVSSYTPRKQNLYGCLPSFRHLSNTQLPSLAVA